MFHLQNIDNLASLIDGVKKKNEKAIFGRTPRSSLILMVTQSNEISFSKLIQSHLPNLIRS